MASNLPTDADVVVIGAGLSGLMTARRLLEGGVERVVIVEAQDRIGGRVRRVPVAGGRSLEAGGELIGPGTTRVLELADEFGLEVMDLPFEGKVVRITKGERFVETYPFELSPELGAAFESVNAKLDELAKSVPVDAPWTAEGAAALDAVTIQTWIDQNVTDPTVAELLPYAFLYLGGLASEVSLLSLLWFLSSRGGNEAVHDTTSQRLVGGSSGLVDGLVGVVGRELIFLDSPVRTVRHDESSVTVVTDAGKQIRAKAVVPAISPGLCGRITWDPVLPAKRDRLQSRYLGGHGVKLFGRYSEPWWRDRGFAGVAVGEPTMLFMDVTEPGDDDGTLMAFPDPAYIMGEFGDEALTDDAAAQVLFEKAAKEYFGDDAPDPVEFHNFSWFGDAWSTGCGIGLPPGLLSSVGDALRAPVGRIVWAGTESALPFVDWLEGALLAGERAADEAAALVRS